MIYRTATAREHFMTCACKGHKLFIINRISLIHLKKLRTYELLVLDEFY